MLDPQDTAGRDVVARMLDFFGDRTSWQRRLWMVGSVMRLRETVEAVELLEPVAAAHLSLKDCKQSARDFLKPDPGVAGPTERGRIAGLLSGPVPAGGAVHTELEQIADAADDGYLLRWAAALRAGTVGLGPEAIARYIAAYLLDGGSSPGHLYRWWQRFALYDASEINDLADLLELAQQRIVKRNETFELMVLFRAQPQEKYLPAHWYSAEAASAWLQMHGFGVEERVAGGLVMRFDARDAGAAVRSASNSLDIYKSRIAVGGRIGSLEPLDTAWVAGTRQPIELPRSRRVDVPVLAREGQLFADAADEQVDAGLQLVSHLDEGTAAAAVSGAWAGLESLLKAPGDGGAHEVAPRLAGLVAASFCRSELTDLAWHRIRGAKDETSRALKAMETNLERTEEMVNLIQGGGTGLTHPADLAGVTRVRKIVDDPAAGLRDVRASAGDALRRLYRQRNLVLHAGRTEAVALRSTLRVAAPLVGAGMDRIAHGWFVEGISPLRLCAAAEMQLARLGTEDAVDVTRLLTPGN